MLGPGWRLAFAPRARSLLLRLLLLIGTRSATSTERKNIPGSRSCADGRSSEGNGHHGHQGIAIGVDEPQQIKSRPQPK